MAMYIMCDGDGCRVQRDCELVFDWPTGLGNRLDGFK